MWGKFSTTSTIFWLTHAKSFNGLVPIPRKTPELVQHVYTDACLQGGAGVFNSEWFFQELFQEDDHIAPKEFRMVLVALETWGHLWAGLPVEFHVDNKPVVDICNKKTSDSPILMRFLRHFLMKVAKFALGTVIFTHIPSKENFLADALSRQNFSVIQVPQFNLNSYPTQTSRLRLQDF